MRLCYKRYGEYSVMLIPAEQTNMVDKTITPSNREV